MSCGAALLRTGAQPVALLVGLLIPPVGLARSLLVRRDRHRPCDLPPGRLSRLSTCPPFENYLLGMLAKEPEDRPVAQRAADWFPSGAWQGRPAPLPASTPTGRRPGTQL
jgi:serine/threonine-protein kinase